jgi:predicted AAA+ superfamily ATPase
MVKSSHSDALYINLLLAKTRMHYQADPERLLEVVRAQPVGTVIIIDEIQKVPDLLPLVHVLIEEKKNWFFILTGSSARKLRREGVDLLGGRALVKHLHPFMACELGNRFVFEEVMQQGLLPLRYASKDPDETLVAYVALYLEEEVRAESLVRSIEPFARFLETLSFSHGSTMNLSNVARECAVKRTTAESWLAIVKDLLIAYTVPVFSKRAKRILVSQSKFYFFDVGVYRALRPKSVLDSVSEIEGSALEGLVAQHLRAWIDYTRTSHSLYFWRTKSGVEVDFIVYGELGLWAIEVKNSITISGKDLTGLKNFGEDYPEATLLLLYRGKERLMKGRILCLPCDEFLQQLVPDRSIKSR